MATLRTYDEKLAIVNHCVELEKAGGDILGYLWSEDYLTPRATWFNFQREWLGRKPYEYTDGEPKKGEDKMDRIRLTDEEKLKAAELAISGGGVYPYLESLGAKNPAGMWRNIKGWIQKNDPELFAKIPGYLTPGPKVDKGFPKAEVPEEVLGRPKTDFVPATVKVDGALKIETPEANRVRVVETPETPKITKPVTYDGMEMTACRSTSTGIYYEYSAKTGYFFAKVGECDQIDLKMDDWKKLLAELPKAMACLGVEV